MSIKKVNEFEVLNHGVEYSDYFQGCGTACTKYSDVVTGIGCSDAEALEDALEQIATGYDVDTEDLEQRIKKEYGEPSDFDVVSAECEEDEEESEGEETPWVHISIRWNTEKE